MPNVDIKISPENLLPWSNMEDWDNGTSSAPTEHTLSGASATVARNSSIVKQGTYSAAVTRSGTDTTLYYDFPDYADYLGRKMTFGCWVYATVASRGRIAISDGVGSTNSSYHTGGSSWEYLSVTHNVDSSATRIRVEMHVNTGNTTVYFDGGILVEGADTFIILTDYSAIGNWNPSNRYVGQEFMVARRTGMKMPNALLQSKTIKVEGQVATSSSTTSRTYLDTISKALNADRYKPNGDKEMRDLYLFDDRFIRGHINSYNPEQSAALRVIDFEFNLVAPDPFFYFINMTRTKQTITGTTTFTVTSNGTAFTRPIIKITNSSSNISSLTVENLTTGQTFSYAGSLVTNKTLVLDSNDLTVENDGTDDYANFTGDADIIVLPGDNSFKVTGVVSGTIKVDFYDRWY